MDKLKDWVQNNVEKTQENQYIDDVVLGELIQLGEVARLCGWDDLVDSIELEKARHHNWRYPH